MARSRIKTGSWFTEAVFFFVTLGVCRYNGMAAADVALLALGGVFIKLAFIERHLIAVGEHQEELAARVDSGTK